MVGPFVLLRRDWTEWFWRVEASVVMYVQLEPWKTVKSVKNGKEGHF